MRKPFRRAYGRAISVSLAVLLLAAALLPDLSAAETAPAVESDPYLLPATDDGLPGAGPLRRYDWFQNLWRQRRSAWAKTAEQDRGAVVFLGDSITQGWGGGLSAAFPGVKVVNRGISGDTTRGVLIRLDDVLAIDPAAIVLLIGTNDLEEGAAPEVIAGNFKLILGKLEAHDPHMPIVLCTVFPSSVTMKRPVDLIQKVNELYLAAVKGDPQVTVVETWQLFADAEGNAPQAQFPDLLHPNEVGYARWAAALRPIFATLGFMETEPPFEREPDFEGLFNGHDLTGWGFHATTDEERAAARKWRENDPKHAAVFADVKQAVRFDGQPRSSDDRYVALNGRLVVTTPPEYRRIEALWTTREFPEDFVLRLEFRATPYADSGVFVRGKQLQCRDYVLAGPYYHLDRYKPQDWNKLEVIVRGGVAHCTCNGEVLEDAMPVPATGPIGLEGDRGQMEYRRIRIKILE